MKNYHRSLYHGRKGKNQSFSASLKHAVHGLILGFLFEANLRRQVAMLVLAVALGWVLRITPLQWAALVTAAALVIILELINSSIEALADAVHPDYSEHIQRSKDLSAAAVLGGSGLALAVGLVIFAPPLLDLVR
jgi:diacylglycerol kinase